MALSTNKYNYKIKINTVSTTTTGLYDRFYNHSHREWEYSVYWNTFNNFYVLFVWYYGIS